MSSWMSVLQQLAAGAQRGQRALQLVGQGTHVVLQLLAAFEAVVESARTGLPVKVG